ncbi:MAG: SMC-Scp complex subunit ScpB [Actinomycetota bacterium]|nr:SMC-Scp complex subunit ScpB [Actinomycetota bacterium]MDD5667882.1 SMC-Scp complex subunit ScpB [Actinomycetota bacterium]
MEIKPIGGKLWRTEAGQDDIQGMEDIKGALEAMLFVADDPLTPRQLAEALSCDEGKALSALQELREEYLAYNRGMQLREVGGGWRMHTHPAYAPHIEKLLLASRRARLTRAAVETLAIVAYLQPITRGQVANLRGVQSENMVKVLEEQGLVAEAGKERAPGGPALYVTTDKFLERFGLNSLDDLSPLEDFEPDRETVQRIAMSLSGQVEAGSGAGGGDADDLTRNLAAPGAGSAPHADGATADSLAEDGRHGHESVPAGDDAADAAGTWDPAGEYGAPGGSEG